MIDVHSPKAAQDMEYRGQLDELMAWLIFAEDVTPHRCHRLMERMYDLTMILTTADARGTDPDIDSAVCEYLEIEHDRLAEHGLIDWSRELGTTNVTLKAMNVIRTKIRAVERAAVRAGMLSAHQVLNRMSSAMQMAMWDEIKRPATAVQKGVNKE